MPLENDQSYYQRRAEQQLEIASAAADPAIKMIHLDLASRYATLRELAARNHVENRPNLMTPIPIANGR